MNTFRVISIDADKDPGKLAEKNVQFDDLRSQVSYYLSYMQTKTGLPRESIICSMTLDRALIEELLSTNQGAEGIRIYLTKESGDVGLQTDVSFLTLPVKRETSDGPNKGLLVEMTPPETVVPKTTMAFGLMAVPMEGTQSLLAFEVTCPTGACPPATTMKTNHTLLS